MSNDGQFVRNAFDGLYALPNTVRRFNDSIPRRVRIIAAFVGVAVLTFVFIIAVSFRLLEALEWANRPALITRLEVPYDLSLGTVPSLDTTLYTGRPVPVIWNADYEATLHELGMALYLEEHPIAEGDTASVTADAATLAPYLAQITDERVVQRLFPDFSAEYYAVLPSLEGYDLTIARESLVLHPSSLCLVSPAEAENACGVTATPAFIEIGDYHNVATGSQIRVTVAQYPTEADGRETMFTLLAQAQAQGVLGNFAVPSASSRGYFYALSDGVTLFGWSNGTWIYLISSVDLEQIEVIAKAIS